MRTHVSKMFVGDGTSVGFPTPGEVAAAPWGAIQALLNSGTPLPIAAVSDEFGFVSAGVDGEYIVSGPFSSASSIIESNPYTAPTQQVSTITVDVTDLVDGKSYIVKVVYHDNLSIIPNQMKFTTVSVVFTTGMTATTFAAAIAAEFNKQDHIFVSVSAAVAVITFTGLVLTTASKYNRIDRPEMVVFEVAAGDMTFGNYPTGAFTIANPTPAVLGQGSAEQTAWLEDKHQGRRGYSDRTQWNDGKRFVPSAIQGVNYTTIVVTDNKTVEGELEGLRANPIGAIIGENAVGGVIVGDLNIIVAPNVVNVIEHPVDS